MEEKRKFQRTTIEPLDLEIEEIEFDSGKRLKHVMLILNDVSEEGIRFTSDIDMQEGESVRFHIPSLDIESLVQGKVAWKKSEGQGKFQYGMHVERSDSNK
ncbi:PilZ domain-containing protein [Paenibacillus physcomitrellae]|uniref:PilZ domain-containing protein n=1 Tax=Paenibacillus physcomitrellae TaxID=1619311 RepID=A0ABQ1FTB0_9BACL|nr:PilZ domain-containing protein [Paenibacillus physcomitrellae]GGA29667.1 hypothetical protein GCM10010917_13380 [Paenibacillus physcomitrellae]